MDINVADAFGSAESECAVRLLACAVARTGKPLGLLLAPALRELVYLEARRPEVIQEADVLDAEERAGVTYIPPLESPEPQPA